MSNKKGDFFMRLSAYHDEVTGSRFVLYFKRPEEDPIYIGIDRGLNQERKYQELNYINEFDDSKLDALIITHNHADHQGMVPFAVRNGYRKEIYMTSFTARLIYPFWIDSVSHQGENASTLAKKHNIKKIPELFCLDDAQRAMNLIKPMGYLETYEILPGIKLTFLDNGHLIDSSMVLLQISSYGRKDINILFTGDYKPTSEWKEVLPIPQWVKELELIVVCESTYGTTLKRDIEKCFEKNILDAISEGKRILIPVFAQGRMQHILYWLKCLQDAGKIPAKYSIYLDGSLGITTCMRYASILREINPKMQDFMPSDLIMVDISIRSAIAMSKAPAIIVSTSGMISQGPAKTYVEHMLSNPKALIHTCGYASEESLARHLIETEYGKKIKINGTDIVKRCDVKSTGECSSHATADELLQLLNQLNIQCLFINHGEFETKAGFEVYVKENGIIRAKDIFQLDRSQIFTIYQLGREDDEYPTLKVNHFSSRLIPNEDIEKVFVDKYAGRNKEAVKINDNKKKRKKTSYNNNCNKKGVCRSKSVSKGKH